MQITFLIYVLLYEKVSLAKDCHDSSIISKCNYSLPQSISSIAMTEKRKFVQAGYLSAPVPKATPSTPAQLWDVYQIVVVVDASLTYTAPAASIVLAGSAPAATAALRLRCFTVLLQQSFFTGRRPKQHLQQGPYKAAQQNPATVKRLVVPVQYFSFESMAIEENFQAK